MENIFISKVCGLCAGCKKAIETAETKAKQGKVVLFKEIVHNKNANEKLFNLGIRTTDNLQDVEYDECVILCAHGEPPETYDYLTKHNIKFVDCTCPNVTKIHNLAREFSDKGFTVAIIGKYGKQNGKMHPEIAGTIGWCKKNILIEDVDDLNKLKTLKNEKIYLICQTTFNEKKADELISKIEEICKENKLELIVNKSICNAQKAINIASVELAKNSDIMIVVGGKNSSNSVELFNNVKTYTNTIFIENIYDWQEKLKNNNLTFNKNTRFGITAGASTLKEDLIKLKQLITEKEQILWKLM